MPIIEERGFTLVELLIVAVLTVIVAGGLLTAFLTGQTSYFSADAYIQVQQEARRAFDTMVRELREAGAVAGNLVTVTANDPSGSGSNQLNFQLVMGYNSASATCTAAGMTSGICWGDGTTAGNWVHYLVITNNTISPTNPRQLVRCIDAVAQPAISNATGAGCRVLANNVARATFAVDVPATPEVVTLSLRIQYQSGLLPGGSQSIGTVAAPLTSRVRLRNAT